MLKADLMHLARGESSAAAVSVAGDGFDEEASACAEPVVKGLLTRMTCE